MQDSILDSAEDSIVSKNINSSINYPSLLTRIKSTLIDGILVLIIFIITSNILSSIDNPPVWLKIAIFFGMTVVYEPLLTSFGCTVGHWIMGIRVRDVNDHAKKINIVFSVIRYIVKGIFGWISLFSISFTSNKRALHDMASGSTVVYNKQKV